MDFIQQLYTWGLIFDWQRLQVSEYLESLYAIAKYAAFAQPHPPKAQP